MRFVAVVLVAGLLAGVDAAGAQTRSLPAVDGGAYRDTLDIFQPQPFELRPFVVRGSERVFVSGTRLDTTAYRIDYRHGRLWLEEEPPSGWARLVVVYRTLPFRFEDVYRRHVFAEAPAADSAAGRRRVVEEENAAGEEREGFQPFEGLTLKPSGSISRSVVTGSNRDVGIASGLRMQMAGEITEGVNVRAVLTDANTPIQPEGTTQRLRDFDRVFVEVEAPQGTARLGDVNLDFEETAFARVQRKLQGAVLTGRLADAPSAALEEGSVTLVGATARGVYCTQDIRALDGVQGPYRLEGRDGERFIIVIAGSETVYLDGRALTRGAAHDYVIDYASGEITFTPNVLITADRRITVEFQYRTGAFTRTLVGAQGQAGFWQRSDGTARLELGATFLREADSRQLGASFALSSEDSLRLVRAGDEGVLRSGAERVAFDPEAPYVQYRRVVREGAAPVFVALDEAPSDSAVVYRVRFTRVGEGQGSYARAGRSVNGILYEYRGEGQGAYTPFSRLPQPRQQRLFDLHGQFEPVRGVEVFGEWARSLNDLNRLSERDAGDDRGQAYRAGLRIEPIALDLGGFDLGILSGAYHRRHRGRHFTSFVRTRPVEFSRRWNLGTFGSATENMLLEAGDETTDEARVELALTPRTRLVGEAGRLTLSGAFQGWRRAIDLAVGDSVLPRLDYRAEYVTSRDRLRAVEGTWLRRRGALTQPFFDGRFVPRFEVEQERREQRVLGTDSLARRSFSFVEYRPGLAYRTEGFEVGGEVEYRVEEAAAEGRLRDVAQAWTVLANMKYDASETIDLEARVGYHVREHNDYFRINEQRADVESVVLRSRTRFQPFDGAIEVDGFYQAQTERTPTLQEIYVRTGPVLGEYVWEDADGDGLIQVDEFIPERTPGEGAYVRRFVPSDSLAPAIDLEARLRLRLDPAKRWRSGDAWWQRALAQVEAYTVLEVQEKSRTPRLADVYLLRLGTFRQPGLTQDGRLRLGQELYLFRRAPRYDLDLSFNQTRGLRDLAAGAEQRFLQTWEVEGRYQPDPSWGLKLTGRTEQNRLLSETFASRTYDIRGVRLEPEATVNLSQALRLTGGVSFARKRDAVGARRARVWKVPLEARYTLARRLHLTARAEAAHVALEGEAVGLARFELTDGRGPGTSFLWSLHGRYTINSYLRLTLSYDGRAPAQGRALNTLRLGMNASF